MYTQSIFEGELNGRGRKKLDRVKEVSRDKSKTLERRVRIEIPTDMELSEEEMKTIVEATENEIIDVIRDAQAQQLAAKAEANEVSVGVVVSKSF